MDGSMLVATGTAVLGSLGILESVMHGRFLRKIPIRIHVNGTRGKSGVTRLIAAGLRAGGVRTCAKTTGTLPRMIFPDGSEYPVFRSSRANIIEQLRIVRAAARAEADALVIECMALQPALQSLCELKIIRATHGVITNARADHLDVMGPTVNDVARSLAGTIPAGAIMYTAEQRHLPLFRTAAADRQCEVVEVNDDDVAEVTWDELERFPYIEHPDNVALALRVCQDLGVDRETALAGMWEAQPDPGVMTVYRARDGGSPVTFINGFAANDPESTGKIWEMVLARFGGRSRHIAVVNCRADRPDRSRQLAEACLNWTPAHHYLVVGSATDLFAKRAVELGLSRQRLTCVENTNRPQLIQSLRRITGAGALVMGMGNISGPGMDLVQHYRAQTVVTSATQSLLRKVA
ncbi:MAG: poly-gamma-glutamate synthase PgsB [Planctomycetaceae bacterium]|nr:poly-gamma-glutamate synthase PgsB [Planctomycetaceae bacterium]